MWGHSISEWKINGNDHLNFLAVLSENRFSETEDEMLDNCGIYWNSNNSCQKKCYAESFKGRDHRIYNDHKFLWSSRQKVFLIFFDFADRPKMFFSDSFIFVGKKPLIVKLDECHQRISVLCEDQYWLGNLGRGDFYRASFNLSVYEPWSIHQRCPDCVGNHRWGISYVDCRRNSWHALRGCRLFPRGQ